MGRILVVDDEAGIRSLIEVMLRRDGHEVILAASGDEALPLLQADPDIELVVSDLRMDGTDGMGLLTALHQAKHQAFVIIMTAFAEWTTAVQAMRLGAYTFLRKPFDNDHVRSVIARALAARDRLLAAAEAGEGGTHVDLMGSSAAIQAIQQLIEQVSTTDSTVLVTGESGTGKELVARAVHYSSLRADGPMVRVNSAALTPSLLESELFGHVKGAFTSALQDRKGYIESASGGTLVLDDLGQFSPEAQVKLLRVLQEGHVLPVGASKPVPVDVRFVATSSVPPETLVEQGRLREDLYFRLKVIEIPLPALRERRGDLPELTKTLLKRLARRHRRPVPTPSESTIEKFLLYPWPGNVRELENVLELASTLAWAEERTHIFPDDLPEAVRFATMATPESEQLREVVRRFEREYVAATLRRLGGDKEEAARRLGLSLATLYRKLGGDA